MWICSSSSCKSENPDSSSVCQSCGARNIIPKSYKKQSFSFSQVYENITAIFTEEEIQNISKMKTQVDEENAKEIQRKNELLKFTCQCLKEFPGIASKIGLKKGGPSYQSDVAKHGWGLYYLLLSSGYYLNEYPKDDKILNDIEIKDFAKTINLYFKNTEDVRDMIIAALTGRPIAAK